MFEKVPCFSEVEGEYLEHYSVSVVSSHLLLMILTFLDSYLHGPMLLLVFRTERRVRVKVC